MIDFLLVSIGGFLGAIARAFISKKYNNQYTFTYLGTFIVNMIGSFILGFITGLQLRSNINLFFGIGFLGSFTTFSTFKIENIKLLLSQNRKPFLLYFSLSYIVGISLAGLGFWLSHMFL